MTRTTVVLYTRQGCTLCDAAAAALDALTEELSFAVEPRDVDTDAALVARYGDRVPVVEVGGAVVAEGRIDGGALRVALSERLPG